jgi:hypothetical protein
MLNSSIECYPQSLTLSYGESTEASPKFENFMLVVDVPSIGQDRSDGVK